MTTKRASICAGDNRFETINRAKQHLLEATNIDTSPDEMKALDTFLFRCWQMGWLEKYNYREPEGKPLSLDEVNQKVYCVGNELGELNKKICDLKGFISANHTKIKLRDLEVLESQLQVMYLYNHFLSERLVGGYKTEAKNDSQI